MALNLVILFAKRLGIALTVILCLGAVASAATPTRRVRVLFADFSERMGLFFVAKDQHFFEENGLEADIVQVNSGPVAVAAMAANEAGVFNVSAAGSALGAMVSGVGLVWVAGEVHKLCGQLFLLPEIPKTDGLL